jgi:hypothetical protein
MIKLEKIKTLTSMYNKAVKEDKNAFHYEGRSIILSVAKDNIEHLNKELKMIEWLKR